MKTFTNKLKLLGTITIGTLMVLSLSSCSDDEPAQTVTQKQPVFDHSHGNEVTDLVKHQFEHEFARECVERETRNSVNKDVDRKRFEEPCLCIATYMMKDLTAPEAEKFLKEDKDTRSLQIRFDNAAYHCLQSKQKQKHPVIFRNRN